MAPKALLAAAAALATLGACAPLVRRTSGPAFLTASPPTGEVPERPQRLRHVSLPIGASGSSAALAGIAPWVGLTAVVVAGIAIKRTQTRVRRAAITKKREDITDPYWQTAIIPSGARNVTLTKEEEEAFLEQRCEGIRKHIALSEEQFQDEVDELTWQWARNLLPFVDERRHDLASHKRRTILKQKDFFSKMRLFKPLILKYPTLVKRFRQGYPGTIEDTNSYLHVPWIVNEERIAGFTYEDWAKEAKGGTFESEAWSKFEVNDMVTGVVVGMTEKGAFIEIGAKSWAFMPTSSCSLAPIAHPDEVFQMGQELQAKIVKVGFESQIPGDPKASQIILSLTDLQRVNAWDEIESVVKGDQGLSPIFEVIVKQMRPFGAVVQTSSGLPGLVPTFLLADRANDMSLVGQKISVKLSKVVREKMGISNPLRVSDFPLIFDYQNTATKELAQTLEKGMVVKGEVVAIRPFNVDVSVMGFRCTLSKFNTTSEPITSYNMADIFTQGEEIKAFVSRVDKETGEVTLSTKLLEYKRGLMLRNKKKVFEKAEETAVQARLAVAEEEARMAELVAAPMRDASSEKKKEGGKGKARVSIEDEDDGDIAAF